MARHDNEPRTLQEPQYQQNQTLFTDTLYCTENNYLEQQQQQQQQPHHNEQEPMLFLQDQDLVFENEELETLLAKEEQSQLCSKLESDVFLSVARCEAVEWILRVNERYSFAALTAVLAVNYLDRFLFSFRLWTDKQPWMIQLTAVACLSLAAKVEETQVPLLLDLQLEESKFIFEAKTIQRMEILVLSTLEWKMNPVTPLTFIDCFTRRLGCLKQYSLCSEFIRRCEHVVLSTISDLKSMQYAPSIIAIAIVLHVINGENRSLELEDLAQLLGILRIDEDKVHECGKLVTEMASRNKTFLKSPSKRKFINDNAPSSPNGVIDASFSSSDSWSAASSPLISSPEPLFKKSRGMHGLNDDADNFDTSR